jgi:hypothetical protein
MTTSPYPEEILDDDYEDDGTMPNNVDTLRQAVVGRRIVSAEVTDVSERSYYWGYPTGLVLTLDDGTRVSLADTSDCCAYTTLRSFFLDPASVDHMIMGVGTTDGYTTWHVYADYGDILRLELDWSPGNPFYYGYGFDIHVTPLSTDAQ